MARTASGPPERTRVLGVEVRFVPQDVVRQAGADTPLIARFPVLVELEYEIHV
jgi:hypothetical protein